MDDTQIIDLYWQRSERAIAETDAKYGAYCRGTPRRQHRIFKAEIRHPPRLFYRGGCFSLYLLFYLLLKRIKLRRREELAEGDIKPVADHLYREQLRVQTFAV